MQCVSLFMTSETIDTLYDVFHVKVNLFQDFHWNHDIPANLGMANHH